MKNTSTASEPAAKVVDPIFEIARREASFGHANEFAPIVKGPFFAITGLVPLFCVAAGCVVWRLVKGIFGKAAESR